MAACAASPATWKENGISLNSKRWPGRSALTGSQSLNVAGNAASFSMRMNVETYEGFVENGQIRLPDNVRVPERTRVYVVIPGEGQPSTTRLMSPRLVHPEQAEDFKKTVIPNA